MLRSIKNFSPQSNTSQDWRRRASNHLKNVAALLIERGEQGMCAQGADMYDRRDLYGVSPRSRVSDLIHKYGWDIGSKPGERDCQCYWVRRDGDGRTYPTRRFDDPPNSPPPQLPDAESAFMRRRREEEAEAMPLFAGARQ